MDAPSGAAGPKIVTKSDNHSFDESHMGVNNCIFDAKYLKPFCKIVLATEGGKQFFKTSDGRSELDQESHERGILKLAVLMQMCIMIRSA